MRLLWTVCLLNLTCAAACGGSGSAVTSDGGGSRDGGSADGGPGPVQALTYGPLGAFSQPTAEYVAFHQAARGALDFDRSLFALAVHDDRLYVGHGDATLNLGTVQPIEVRSLTAPDAAPRSEGATGEEAITLFRHCGEVFCIPGIDATENGLVGNVYFLRPGAGDGGAGDGGAGDGGGGRSDAWQKVRGVPGALHVHDLTRWRGLLYAVGSGAPTMDEYNAGRIRGYLWRSRDEGNTWEIAQERVNSAGGDLRFTHFLPLGDALYVFGFRSSGGRIVEFLPYRFDGTALETTPLASMARVYVLGTWQLSATRGLVRGIDASAQPLRFRTWLVEAGEARVVAGALDALTLVDAEPQPDGSALLLVTEGNERDTPPPRWETRILWTADFTTFRSLAAASLDPGAQPTSLASWRQSLWVGDAAGTLWRATGR